MEQWSDRELQRRLRNFDAVWSRVGAAGAPRETAERCGVKLMPRKNCCRGRQQRPAPRGKRS